MTTPETGESPELKDELEEAIRWTEERWGEGDPQPLAPLAAQAAQRWQRPGADDLEPASQALVRIARLVEKTTRSLFPDPPSDELDDDEAEASPFLPGEELLARLAALEAFQEVAHSLEDLQAKARRTYTRGSAGRVQAKAPEPQAASPEALLDAFRTVWTRARDHARQLPREAVSIGQRMRDIEARVADGDVRFEHLFGDGADRRDVIVTFLALLELIRMGRVRARQREPLAPITIARGTPAGGSAGASA